MVTVLVAWVGLGVALVLRARRGGGPPRRRAAGSLFGMALHGVGFGLVFSVHRQWTGMHAAEFVLTGLAIFLAAVAVLLVGSALRTLGKQWSLAARLLENHQLITTGPYALVRHPIYAGFLSLLLATGAAKSGLAATAGASVLYVIGTFIRTSREERLLREAFGAEYEAYARQVPALLPRIRTGAGPRLVLLCLVTMLPTTVSAATPALRATMEGGRKSLAGTHRSHIP